MKKKPNIWKKIDLVAKNKTLQTYGKKILPFSLQIIKLFSTKEFDLIAFCCLIIILLDLGVFIYNNPITKSGIIPKAMVSKTIIKNSNL